MRLLHAIKRRVPTPLKRGLKHRLELPMAEVGQRAPGWRLQNWEGSWHDTQRARTLLIFYPGDDTPGCTAQLQDLQEQLAIVHELGWQAVALNPASLESHQRFAERYGFTFPILHDPGAATAAGFGASWRGALARRVVRSVFVTDPDSTIRYAARGAPAVRDVIATVQRGS